MMSISSSTKKDFTKIFLYLNLTAVPGKPTYAEIEQIQREIFACASSIASMRGGGKHGEIGLVMTPSDYDLIAPATTYTHPVHPWDPPTFDGMPQHKIHVNGGHYIARVYYFNNINQIEQQLTNLLLSAYDRKWLAVIMDPVTGQINKQLPLILSLLYTNYGQITPTALNQKRDACTNLICNPREPIDQIWVQITIYSLMAQAAKSPATSEQLINIGIIILQRTGVFTHNIREWIKCPAQEHSWLTFQEHLSNSQLELEIAQPTANSMSFHNQSANNADKIVKISTTIYQPTPPHLPLTTKNQKLQQPLKWTNTCNNYLKQLNKIPTCKTCSKTLPLK